VNTHTSDMSITALLVIDPYNDFISEGGKIWPRIKAVAEANNCVPNMLEVLNAARKAKLQIFFAMHHRYRPGDYETWKYIAPIQRGAWQRKAFEHGSWGGEFRAEFVPLPARSWRKSTGAPAGSLTLIWTCCSRGKVSISSL
jgi:ureidoacrylate peracid hydrolase